MDNNKDNYYWLKKILPEVMAGLILAFIVFAVSFGYNFIPFNNPDFYKFILSFANLIVVLVFFWFSSKRFELEFAKDNNRHEGKRKDKNKLKYWDLLNVEVKDGLVEVNGHQIDCLEQAESNETRVNLLVEQLHQNIHLYALFLILVYLLFLIDNETLFASLGAKDGYNLVHPYLKIGEDVFNLLSALFVFLGFKVLYDKTLDEKNKKTTYQRGAWAFAIVIVIAYLGFTTLWLYPVKAYRDGSVSNVEKIIESVEKTKKLEEEEIKSLQQSKYLPSDATQTNEILENPSSQTNEKFGKFKELSAKENKNFDDLMNLRFRYYGNVPFTSPENEAAFKTIGSIINSREITRDQIITDLNKSIGEYKASQEKGTEIWANLFLLLIGVYNGLMMALLFGRYISMEERVRGINRIKYKNIFTKLTIYILPIYALSQPLFGAFDISVFGNAKAFANWVFLFCLIGKIFFLFSTYWFMKERLMHYYLHLVLTSHGVPKDFYTCFDYKCKNLIDGQTETTKEKNLKNKRKSLEAKVYSAAVELPTNQSVTDEEVLNLWAARQESAQELARKIRKGNRETND
jgi:hypothetical protein